MTISLIDTVRDALTSGGIVNGAASALGVSPSTATKALSGAGSAILGGLANKARDPLALGEFFNMAQDPALASPTLDDPARLLGADPEATRARDLGSRLMAGLFGGRTDDVVNSLGRHAGLNATTAASVMTLAAPLIMRAFGGLIRGGGLTVGSLGQMLLSNQSEIMNAVPGGVANVVGRAQIYDVAREAGVPRVTNPAIVEPKRPAWWAIPLALLPLVLLGLWFLRDRREEPKPTTMSRYETPAAVNTRTATPTPPPAAKTTTPAPTPAPKPTTSPPPTTTTPAPVKSVHVPEVNKELKFAENGVEQRLLMFLRDKSVKTGDNPWFEFDRLTFHTGGATLEPSSHEQLENLTEILKVYPAIRIKIGGYTDNTGDPATNTKLSQDRADSVKAELVKKGVAADRIETEGYGDMHPVATNDTEAGRAKNRRVALKVLPSKS